MRLSEFILSNMNEILAEWESFAGAILPAADLDKLALRDHAPEILKAIALDMETTQTDLEQAEKSKGLAPIKDPETAAETHSTQRLRTGFNQVQVVSEYRALRASVIRLWLASSPQPDASDLYQLTRFNEGLDQALGESTMRFMQEVESARDFALAVLAHDLRNPLNAVVTSAECLKIAKAHDDETITTLSSIIFDSGMQMSKLIDTLLDFTGTRLGRSLSVKREPMCLRPILESTVASFSAAHPNRTIELNCNGEAQCAGDEVRIRQMLSNLVANAIQHGAETSPIVITSRIASGEIVIQVHNDGPPIPASKIPTTFDFSAQRRTKNAGVTTELGHLGIGLYITGKIVEAHAGKISVTSTAQEGTTFEVRLPCAVT
ncbi:MAG TPA: sensor histidine kinase, partial [Candidatus Nitrosocosmicus sp.]|nr:sensor histidine kinase [Candidatus Nitrosocosmicus sp.]